MPEIELKFAIAPERIARVRAEARRDSERVPMTAAYFDSADGCLFDAGISWRLRDEGGRWVQTAKAPGSTAPDREEHNAPRTSASVKGRKFQPDLALHEGTPAGAAVHEALGRRDAQAPPLQEVFRTVVVRHRRLVGVSGAEVELGFDEGEIVAGERRQPIHEIEFELKDGSPAGLFALARRWVKRHGLWMDGRSKAERGHWLSHGEAGAPPRKAGKGGDDGIEQACSELDLLRALIDRTLAQVIANASEVACGNETPGHVHQLRVGLRRLRTALRAFGDAAPTLRECEPVVAGVFRSLGAWRDAGITQESIAPKLRAAGAPFIDLSVTRDEQLSPSHLVRGTAFQLALLALMEFARAGASPQQEVDGAQAKADALDASIAARLSKLHKHVRDAGRRFEALSVDEQHRVRKRLKRLRYLAEFVGPRYERRAVKRYLAALEPAQDALGAHNDTVVALDRYRAAAAANPQAWFAVGWLTARLEVTAASSRRSLKAIKDVKRFWR
jgi:inorganic triphosphatase YgiF